MHATVLLYLHIPESLRLPPQATLPLWLPQVATFGNQRDMATGDGHLNTLRTTSAARLKQASHTRHIVLNTLLCILDDGLPNWAHTYLIRTTVLLKSVVLGVSAGDHMRYSGLNDCSKTEACTSSYINCCYMLLYMPDQGSHDLGWTYPKKREGETAPFCVNSMRNQVRYWGALGDIQKI